MWSLILSNSPAKLDHRRPGDKGTAWAHANAAHPAAPGPIRHPTQQPGHKFDCHI